VKERPGETGRRRAVGAAASRRASAFRRVALLALLSFAWLAVTLATSFARADDEPVLDDTGSRLRIRSITTRLSAYDQFGHGYQSQAGPVLGAGSERATIFEPQAEVVATQGDRITHRLWIPVDVVSAASPDAIDNGPASVDVMSSASRHVESGTIDWTTTYRASPTTDFSMRNGIHLEEPLRSWNSGVAAHRSFADDATVVSAGAVEVIDWFDKFSIDGHRHGHTDRNVTSGSVGFTQVLTPTTVVNLNYGLTVLEGQLGNTWNSVPIDTGVRGPEYLPNERLRHAIVGRLAQFLPWNGALRLYYRFYTDDWGIVAHSVEGQLMQRLTPEVYIGGYYRFHTQTGASFFTTLASDSATLRVSDSDLAPLQSTTVGGKVVVDYPLAQSRPGEIRSMHFELAIERYTRTNDLQINILSCATGFRF
jgi:hypothetical protein